MSVLSPQLQQFLSTPLKIGTVEVNSRVLQSPLSGVTDLVFRRLVRRYAPLSMMYTEMVHASQVRHLEELPQMMEVDPNERPISIQLFDCRPDFLAEAAQRAVEEGANTVDINMGCPVNKITKKGGGSSLLRQPEVAEAIVQSVVKAVNVPVTVKTRIGWDDNEINILDFAKRMEDSGAAMITIHARTRAAGYNGKAKWEWIAKVKQILSIPVIANGDIVSVESAVNCLQLTCADGVMCSRGTLGYPFLVGEIDSFFKTGEVKPGANTVERLQCAKEHLQALGEYKGERGIYQSRKHMTWYAKGFAGANELRNQLAKIESVEQGCDLIDGAIAILEPTGHREQGT
ncbi:tRNA dihydrouridine synthase DusB [Limnoraphis robusta Tam1]|uniref:tRNA-dihydrouridine synthase n=1 Tax=Limnoraphis robusta CCNP1315 TaxID=3110306 RepID=A0ABU5TSB9_9CYAN|nr:tRNA dihydrouridine synthase DusB [Limnoraphis robusta]MEA5499629.1 tRNA dihydrouridine synthase DusB [Limnoraphis robusta BA-68 BA1]MEA5517779.1 tRNA dihydrouridine synthase DusB [Limnoraphis robusta CCNP1315]MEA5541064.1 tRNA dihydrouridine synthase DusB [Limnoraphis robusta Tam1]MEA5546415.1 tRNA dihydrouridine synthase DusB [Limnoraphis robusta CCNP1324]